MAMNGNILDEDEDDESVLQARCERYNFEFHMPFRRRRIFWGSLIADDSWHVLGIAAMEYRD